MKEEIKYFKKIKDESKIKWIRDASVGFLEF